MPENLRSRNGDARNVTYVVLAVVAVLLLWGYRPFVAGMVRRWSHDPRYSHGFLVPLFALFLYWKRRPAEDQTGRSPSWWGLGFVAAGEAIRYCGSRYDVDWLGAVSLLPSLAGLAVLAGGRASWTRAWVPIAFLVFMIPLPFRAEMALGYPLQRLATIASTFTLQTLGLPAVAEGNVILMDDLKIGVVEACNGLGMLFMFLSLAVATALVIGDGLVTKAAIVAGALPIALAANVTRITMTGLMHQLAGARVADAVYHDLAGWLMMPLALAALWLEYQWLTRLFVAAPLERPATVPLAAAGLRGVPARAR